MGLLDKLLRRGAKRRKYCPGEKINLLIELDTFDKGGLQKVVFDSAKRLCSDSFNVVIVSINGGGVWADEAQKFGLKVYTLNGSTDVKRYRKILDCENIHLSCSHFSLVGYPLFWSLGIPNITFIHNVYAFLAEPALRNFKQDDKYVKCYISVSKKATEYAVEKIGIDLSKIITIPNGLVVDEHHKRMEEAIPVMREDFGLLPDDYVFLNVASYNLHKGHYLMAEAMSKIKASRSDIKILCIGNVIVPQHVEELRQHIKVNGLEDVMLLPGYYPNVESFFKMADAFLLPSFIEGWSIAMNEAMFYGKPMILTDTGGAAEIIENNDIGFLLPNEYGEVVNLDCQMLDELAYEQKTYKITDTLVGAMCDFADNKTLWKKAGAQGREKLLAKYDFNNVVKQYEQIFKNVLL